MTSVAEADAVLAGQVPSPAAEAVPLAHACGRVLFEAARADRDGPPYDRVAMDGYAIAAAEGSRSWTVVGLQTAGRPALTREAGAVEVATGAVLPRGCDTIVPYEHTTRQGDVVTLTEDRPLPMLGASVHRRGTDYRTGEVLLPAGAVLRSPHLHTLATVGADPVLVVRRAVWSLAATGDELVDVRDLPRDWQIRRSNGAAIAGEASAWGLSPQGQVSLPDHRERLKSGLEALLPGLDALVLTGGVSAGALDLVPAVLDELGAVTLFHRLPQRPGKPMWCGKIPGGPLVFGLPGNPVSSLVAFRRYVLPWLLAFEGRPSPERRVHAVMPVAPAGVTVFLPWSETEGALPWTGSGDFHALVRSTGFVQLDDTSGSEPRYFPWGGQP